MNFKRYHESKNLLCESATTTYTGDLTIKTVANSSKVVLTKSTTSQPVSTSTDVNISLDAGTYTISVQGLNSFGDNFDRLFIRDSNNNIIVQDIRVDASKTFTISSPTTISKVIFVARADSEYNDTEVTLMLNTGSQSLPYEPYSSEVWHDTPHYIMGTSTDTITTLPAVLYANDTTATVGLKGGMSQTGTPSPTTPIQPQECGERTAQLFDYQTGTPTAYKYLDENGNEVVVTELAPWYITDYISIPDGVLSVTLSKIGGGVPAMCAYDASKNYITGIKYNTGSAVTKVDITLTSSTPIRFIRFSYFLGNTGYDDLSTKMLNSGSTALPYEPYGYKIPILSNSTTTPVYLGEVQSTRKIKKLVLTGEETSWQSASASEGRNRFTLPIQNAMQADTAHFTSLSTHLPLGVEGATWNTDDVYTIVSSKLYMRLIAQYNTLADFKSYLAAQYAAGTPVTIWYVLAEPTTGIVNEPLRKIGTYADEVSGITIPTIAGANTLSIGTTLQPSEVTVNYKGWHPVQSVHEMHTHLDASLFELGTITGYGQKDELTTRIRTKTFIDLSNMKSINTLSSAKVFLIAWTEEATTIGYYYCVGGWNGSSFGNQTGLWLSEIDVESIVETYPTYKFAVILRYDDNREVTDFDDLLSLVDFYPKTW